MLDSDILHTKFVGSFTFSRTCLLLFLTLLVSINPNSNFQNPNLFFEFITKVLRSPQVRMQSSNHRLRDMEQHHPLLSAGPDVEAGSLAGGVIVGVPHPGHTAANRTLWFIQDSCGMVCAGMTWFLVLYAEFVVNFVMLLPSKSFWYSLLNGAAFNSLAVLALASHLRTMLTDPVGKSSDRVENLLQS